jgi:lipopolysaccharide transport system permease protein
MACIVGGSLSFIQADAYIKQMKHPLAIYTLRTIFTSLLVLALASIALIGWSGLALPHNIGIHWFLALSIFPALALILWPLSTLLAYIGAKYRDIPHAMGLIMQALWFISPVYFEEKMFRQGGLDALVDYNPIYHLLQLLRAPLISGKPPDLENYLYPIFTGLVLALVAWLVGRKVEEKIIFYL